MIDKANQIIMVVCLGSLVVYSMILYLVSFMEK
jgi:hypothetical protein